MNKSRTRGAKYTSASNSTIRGGPLGAPGVLAPRALKGSPLGWFGDTCELGLVQTHGGKFRGARQRHYGSAALPRGNIVGRQPKKKLVGKRGTRRDSQIFLNFRALRGFSVYGSVRRIDRKAEYPKWARPEVSNGQKPAPCLPLQPIGNAKAMPRIGTEAAKMANTSSLSIELRFRFNGGRTSNGRARLRSRPAAPVSARIMHPAFSELLFAQAALVTAFER